MMKLTLETATLMVETAVEPVSIPNTVLIVSVLEETLKSRILFWAMAFVRMN